MGAVEDTCKSSARGVLPSAMSAASHLRTLAVVILESKQRILVLGKNGYEPECQKWPHDFLSSYPFSVFEGHIYIYIYMYIYPTTLAFHQYSSIPGFASLRPLRRGGRVPGLVLYSRFYMYGLLGPYKAC